VLGSLRGKEECKLGIKPMICCKCGPLVWQTFNRSGIIIPRASAGGAKRGLKGYVRDIFWSTGVQWLKPSTGFIPKCVFFERERGFLFAEL
jgi:hypothetical protein